MEAVRAGARGVAAGGRRGCARSGGPGLFHQRRGRCARSDAAGAAVRGARGACVQSATAGEALALRGHAGRLQRAGDRAAATPRRGVSVSRGWRADAGLPHDQSVSGAAPGGFPWVLRETIRVARAAGLVHLGVVTIDGTKVRAHTSWHTARSHARRVAEEAGLERECAAILARRDDVNAAEDTAHGDDDEGSGGLPAECGVASSAWRSCARCGRSSRPSAASASRHSPRRASPIRTRR